VEFEIHAGAHEVVSGGAVAGKTPPIRCEFRWERSKCVVREAMCAETHPISRSARKRVQSVADRTIIGNTNIDAFCLNRSPALQHE
jgi:hypothetical protein